MSEVAVAFPNDETTAEVIASRLRADGIVARVDRVALALLATAVVVGVVAILVAIATR